MRREKSDCTMSQEPFLRKLTLRNFRSIRSETVTFANPLFLVGRNGSGKSNFVSALAFLSECMEIPLQSVVEQWGGVDRLCHRLTAPDMSLRADIQLDSERRSFGTYAFTLRVTDDMNLVVAREQCHLEGETGAVWFERSESDFSTNIPGIQPALDAQSLVLPILGGVKVLYPLYRPLRALKTYQIRPEVIGAVQEQSSSPYLRSDGSNSNSVLLRLAKRDNGFIKHVPSTMSRVGELLQSIVPGVSLIPPEFDGGQGVLSVEQDWAGIKAVFRASSVSTGTLYALGLIVAAMQEPAPSVIAIEEPELNIHPGALDAIGDILNVAAQRTQVVVTTHSPDLIDAKWIQPENLRVVEWANGETRISELGAAPVRALREHLMGAGELMRANALDAAPLSASEDTADLFEKVTA